MNCDSIPTAYAVSRCDTTVGHKTDLIASEYGILLIRAAWLGVDGDCCVKN